MTKAGKFVASLVLLPILVLVIGIGGCEVYKAYYDKKVREMCARDGGVIIYERLPVSTEVLAKLSGPDGHLRLPFESDKMSNAPAFIRSTTTPLLESHVTLVRYEFEIVRRSDSMVLARRISYGRSGGDFPFTGSAASYFQCPTQAAGIVRQVVVPEEGWK